MSGWAARRRDPPNSGSRVVHNLPAESAGAGVPIRASAAVITKPSAASSSGSGADSATPSAANAWAISVARTHTGRSGERWKYSVNPVDCPMRAMIVSSPASCGGRVQVMRDPVFGIRTTSTSICSGTPARRNIVVSSVLCRRARCSGLTAPAPVRRSAARSPTCHRPAGGVSRTPCWTDPKSASTTSVHPYGVQISRSAVVVERRRGRGNGQPSRAIPPIRSEPAPQSPINRSTKRCTLDNSALCTRTITATPTSVTTKPTHTTPAPGDDLILWRTTCLDAPSPMVATRGTLHERLPARMRTHLCISAEAEPAYGVRRPTDTPGFDQHSPRHRHARYVLCTRADLVVRPAIGGAEAVNRTRLPVAAPRRTSYAAVRSFPGSRLHFRGR